MKIAFEIPGQPVAKGRPRFARRGNFVTTYTPEKTVNYEKLVKIAAAKAMNGKSPSDRPIDLEIELHMQIPVSWSKTRKDCALNGLIRHTKKPDIDNLVKSVKDGCNGVVWIDDSQVVSLVVRKLYSERPVAYVTFEESFGVSA